MFNANFLGIPFYQFIINFMCYSFLGWALETFLCSVQEKKFVNRGFLVTPFCPIYGFGVNIIIIILLPVSENTLFLYVFSVILVTILEFFVGWLLEVLFKAKWWDYSQWKFNIKGRVCLAVSLGWGVLGVLIVKLVHPLFVNATESLSSQTVSIICTVFLVVFILDTVGSAFVSAGLSNKIKSLSQLSEEIREAIHNSRIAESANGWKEKLTAMKLPQLNTEFLTTFPKDKKPEENLSVKIQKYYQRYNQKDSRLLNAAERRILRAFPNMKSKRNDTILKELRERLANYKK